MLGEVAKRNVNIAALGSQGHGKTTLTAALTKLLAKYGGRAYTVNEIENGWQDEETRHHFAHITTVEYYTKLRHYTHVDCPTRDDYIKGMISGEVKLDGAILVVSAMDGIMPQTREHVALSKEMGVSYIVVFINKCDLVDDAELLDLQEMEARELLIAYGFPGDDVPVIRGSALQALNTLTSSGVDNNWVEAMLDLTEMMDEFIPETILSVSKPFLMPIANVINIPNQGVAANGYIETGIIKKGMAVDVVGIRSTRSTTCTQVQIGTTSVDYALPDDNVNIFLSNIALESIERGQVLATPGSIQSFGTFQSEIYFFSNDDAENEYDDDDTSEYGYVYKQITSHFQNYPLSFYFRVIGITGVMQEFEHKWLRSDVKYLKTMVQLQSPAAINMGDHFTVLENGRTVAIGLVIKLIG